MHVDRYLPRVYLVIVAQKRHNPCIFNDQFTLINVASGTLVDSKMTHPCDLNHYLCSDDSKTGTSRATHHTVILDEKFISPYTLYNLTLHSCERHPPWTPSISIALPFCVLTCPRNRLVVIFSRKRTCTDRREDISPADRINCKILLM